jgi:hypothetical protein
MLVPDTAPPLRMEIAVWLRTAVVDRPPVLGLSMFMPLCCDTAGQANESH